MLRYVIERDIPGIGGLSPEEYCAGAQRSKDALDAIGTRIQWVQSFVTGDKIYCVYLADNEGLIHEHAERSGFPANRVEQVRTVMDPTTAAR
ncbi:MAG: DUF4242 domain-containing protein [Ectothiorhodospiraceae bacterium]|nr:DUF4242 domain-containing protein [Ectothiorhodospiraceae bacterium]MCH8505252.1 DUF4242 domain-containing protein [Ectothiorhodospiraceae bacterium]